MRAIDPETQLLRHVFYARKRYPGADEGAAVDPARRVLQAIVRGWLFDAPEAAALVFEDISSGSLLRHATYEGLRRETQRLKHTRRPSRRLVPTFQRMSQALNSWLRSLGKPPLHMADVTSMTMRDWLAAAAGRLQALGINHSKTVIRRQIQWRIFVAALKERGIDTDAVDFGADSFPWKKIALSWSEGDEDDGTSGQESTPSSKAERLRRETEAWCAEDEEYPSTASTFDAPLLTTHEQQLLLSCTAGLVSWHADESTVRAYAITLRALAIGYTGEYPNGTYERVAAQIVGSSSSNRVRLQGVMRKWVQRWRIWADLLHDVDRRMSIGPALPISIGADPGGSVHDAVIEEEVARHRNGKNGVSIERTRQQWERLRAYRDVERTCPDDVPPQLLWHGEMEGSRPLSLICFCRGALVRVTVLWGQGEAVWRRLWGGLGVPPGNQEEADQFVIECRSEQERPGARRLSP